jgi:hypothetical protein
MKAPKFFIIVIFLILLGAIIMTAVKSVERERFLSQLFIVAPSDVSCRTNETRHCTDNKDNDCDLIYDCSDPDCYSDPTCKIENPGNAIITINDPLNYKHTPQTPFSVTVTLSHPGVAANLFVQWVTSDTLPYSRKIKVMPNIPTTIRAPSNKPGYYGLIFTSDNPQVAFPPQTAGFPSSEYGFSILPIQSIANKQLNPNSLFGTVHTNENDGNLAGYSKTLTWNTISNPNNFALRMNELRNIYKLIELPIINGKDWDVDDSQPISQSQLNIFGQRFGSYLDAFIAHNVTVPVIQFGIEENGGGEWPQLSFTDHNLTEKMKRATQEMQNRNISIDRIFSMRGFDYLEFRNFAQSKSAQYFDILGIHPYKWPDFPAPETWLQDHITNVYYLMVFHGGPTRLWFTEIGLPHRGNNDPNGFFGYPSSGAQVPGASREYVARYIVKTHAETIASNNVEKIFWYNYYDRGEDITYAEDHFGLRTYDDQNKKNGPTKPAYLAYSTLIRFLEKKQFIEQSNPSPDIYVYEFQGAEDILLAWIYPDAKKTVPLNTLKSGLTSIDIIEIIDIYGTPRKFEGESIMLEGRPFYIRIK